VNSNKEAPLLGDNFKRIELVELSRALEELSAEVVVLNWEVDVITPLPESDSPDPP
jgi:hypothetical protein